MSPGSQLGGRLTAAVSYLTGAVSYPLLDKLMFILPLVGILIIGYLGVKSEYMGDFLCRRIAALNAGMAVLFGGLGVLVMATLQELVPARIAV